MSLGMIAALFGVGVFLSKEKISDKIQESSDSWTRFDPLFKKYGSKYGVPWQWLKAFALNESDLGRAKSVARGFENPKDVEGSKSSDGKSWGLMQVTLTTARDLDPGATEMKLNNAEYSIDLAARYVRSLMVQFDKASPRYLEAVAKSYNQGPGNTRAEFRGRPNNPSWQEHVQKYWAKFQKNLKRVEES